MSFLPPGPRVRSVHGYWAAKIELNNFLHLTVSQSGGMSEYIQKDLDERIASSNSGMHSKKIIKLLFLSQHQGKALLQF